MDRLGAVVGLSNGGLLCGALLHRIRRLPLVFGTPRMRRQTQKDYFILFLVVDLLLLLLAAVLAYYNH